MTIKEWYDSNFDLYHNKQEAVIACAMVCGVQLDSVRRKFDQFKVKSSKVEDYVQANNEKIKESEKVFKGVIEDFVNNKMLGLSENELRMKHDLFFIVKENAEKLEKGVYLPEPEFIRFSNLKGAGYRAALDHPSFNEYKGKAGGVTYWSNKESIYKMKKEGVLC